LTWLLEWLIKVGVSVLKSAREVIQKSQDEIAEELGVTQGTVSGWERGAIPHRDRWIEVAKAYGISMKELLRSFAYGSRAA
jgi:transcriptional regulator with XRE-family HTH domain